MAWCMRGGVSYSEMLDSSISDLKYFSDVIEENIELSNKTKQLII